MGLWAVVAVVAAALLFEREDAITPPDQTDMIQQEVKYIWPTTTWSVPLTTPAKDGKSLLDPAVVESLADMGASAFDKYVNDILPKELEADSQFAAEFAASDATRINNGFSRWQKRVYSELKDVPLNELSWDGSPIPHYPKISYQWEEFYKSREYKRLRHQIERLSGMYLNNMGKNDHGGRQRFRTFIWVEVFRQRDSMRPHVHTGAHTAGVIFARYHSSEAGAQKFAFEDPRGINPPFGKTHNHQPEQGELLMFPSWASHFVSPHPLNSTNVVFNFVCWPPDGAPDLDWEDDAAGDYVYKKQMNIKRPKSRATQAPEISKKERHTEL